MVGLVLVKEVIKTLRVVSVELHPTDEQYLVIRELSHYAKNLYNEALYLIKTHYEESLNESQKYYNSIAYLGVAAKGKGEHLTYYDVDPMLRNSRNYKMLSSASAQGVIRTLDASYKAFFGSMKGRKNGTIDHKVRSPMFMPKDAHAVVKYTYNAFGFNGRTNSTPTNYTAKNQKYITLAVSKEYAKVYPERKKLLKFIVPPYLRGVKINEVRLVPNDEKGKTFKLEFVYEERKAEYIDNGKYLSIDLGLKNFATYYESSTGSCGIIDGSYIKSVNQWYNKENARLKSIMDKQKLNGNTKALVKLLTNRNNRIKEFLNRAVDKIIKICFDKDIKNVIVGELKDIKQEANLGKRTNQNFVQIPYHKFKQKLKSKCEIYGIKYTEVDEAYTSRTDALAFDKITKQEYGNSRRIKRGLYNSSTGVVLNADVNGAINIMRKVAGDPVVKQVIGRGVPITPRRIRLAYEQTSPELNDSRRSHP
jgi:putative transposase